MGDRPQAPAGERWVVVRTTAGEERARATLARQVEVARQTWEQALWHLSHQRFACAPDAEAALAQQRKQLPPWLTVQYQLTAHPKQARPGRLRAGTPPDRTEWQIQATVAVEEAAVTRAVQRKAAFLVATNVLDTSQLTDQELIQTYKEQHSVERGFSFLKDPLFLALYLNHGVGLRCSVVRGGAIGRFWPGRWRPSRSMGHRAWFALKARTVAWASGPAEPVSCKAGLVGVREESDGE